MPIATRVELVEGRLIPSSSNRYSSLAELTDVHLTSSTVEA